MQTAYVDAAGTSSSLPPGLPLHTQTLHPLPGRSNPHYTNSYNGHLGGQVLTPGLYNFDTSVDITSDVYFAGNANASWILQMVSLR